MERLIDYVRWVGDLDFHQKPFCEMDVLILNVVGYLDMKPVYEVEGTGTPDVKNMDTAEVSLLPKVSGEKRLTVREISDRIRTQGLNYYVRTVGPDNGQIELQDAIAASRRFGEVIVKDYVDEFDADLSLQFSAMTFEAAGKRIISYCGTDHTIAGWKEDFMISFTHPLAQDLAVAYAEKEIAREPEIPFLISGHSKGGNLALYAACMMSDEAWSHVEHVYDLDGPGLCPDVIDLKVLDRIQDRTTLIGPEYAVISKLFEVDLKDKRIIRSDETGIVQHGLYSWCTDHGEPALAEKNDPRSLILDQAVDRWMSSLTTEERKHFVDELFDSLSAGGKAVTLDDIGRKGGPGYEEVLIRMLSMDEKTKQVLRDLPLRSIVEKEVQDQIETSIREVRRSGPVEWFLQSEPAQGVTALISGVLVVLMASFIVDLVVVVPMVLLTGAILILTARRLYRSGWQWQSEKLMVDLSIMTVGALIVVCTKEEAIDILGTMLIGILLLIFAYVCFSKLRDLREDRFGRVIAVLETVIGGLLGICLLLIPTELVRIMAIVTGGALSTDGILHLIHGIGNSRRK